MGSTLWLALLYCCGWINSSAFCFSPVQLVYIYIRKESKRFWKLHFHLCKGQTICAELSQWGFNCLLLFFVWLITVLPCQTCIPWKQGTQRRGLQKSEETSQYQPAQQVSLEEEEVWKIPSLWCYHLGLSWTLCHDSGQGISSWVANAILIWNAIRKAVVLFSAELLALENSVESSSWYMREHDYPLLPSQHPEQLNTKAFVPWWLHS